MAHGSVFPHGAGFAIRYDTGNDERTGKRIQVFRSGFESRAKAKVELAIKLAEVAQGTHLRPRADTVESFAEYWLTHIKTGKVRTTTIGRYRDSIKHYIVPTIGPIALQKLKVQDIRAAQATWEKRGLSPQTRSDLHTRVKQILGAALKEGLITRNPLAGEQAPHVPPRDMLVWDAGQLDTFLRMTEAIPFWGALWHVYAMTGIRRGEGLGLRWRDIDLKSDAGNIHIRQQIVMEDGVPVVGEPKTAASRRTVAISAGTVAVLQAHRRQQRIHQMQFRDVWTDMDLVFARQPGRLKSGFGQPWAPPNISSAWAHRVSRYPVPPIKLHGLRHSHATLLLQVDGNIKAIAERLGHDPVVLMKVYAHVVAGAQELAVSRVDAALAQARETMPKTAENEG